MPMLIVDDSGFEKEKSKLIKPTAEIQDINVGRGVGKTEVPESLRKIIGENGIIEGNKETAQAFGVSESSVSAYKNGATSTATYDTPSEGLKNHTDVVRQLITTRAKHKLIRALDHITDDKLEGASLKIIAGVARDMSAIVRNIEPPKEEGDGPRVNFVFYAPHLKNETDYEVIKVLE